jgi:hypothetical protein
MCRSPARRLTLLQKHKLPGPFDGPSTRRCTKLSAVKLAMQGVTLSFSGQGTHPAEHLASMQAQIASFAATPCFLLPPSWSAHPCLTTIAIDRMDAWFAQPTLDLLPHLTAVVSLQSLTLDTIPGAVSSEVQAGISALTNLTHLSAPTHDSAANPLDTFWVNAGLVPRLQQLTVAPSTQEAAPFTIPRAWEGLAGLSRLSIIGKVEFTTLRLAHPDGLHWLPALRSLGLATEYTSLQALSSLSHLTSLGMHTSGDVPAGSMACGPPTWRSSLQALRWWGCVEAAAPCISQWTALTSLRLRMAQPGLPESMAPAIGALQALRELTLKYADVTAELCG